MSTIIEVVPVPLKDFASRFPRIELGDNSFEVAIVLILLFSA